jgi:hypothetical protein
MVLTYASGLFPSKVITTLSESSSVGAIAIVGYNVARATSDSSDLSPHDNGLSTGAKAGIGLGVSLGVLGIGALILLVFLHRRRGKDRSSKPPAAAPVEMSGAEGKASGMAHPDFAQEIDGRPVHSELPSSVLRSPVELNAQGWSR